VTKRTYDQYCPVATALEVLDPRWTLLIVRELLRGPQRYTDLQQALPGIWTNLLAERLRTLETSGVVRRVELPPPAARTVYELTDDGLALEPVIVALGGWGFRRLGEPGAKAVVPVGLGRMALKARFRPEAAQGLTEDYEIHLGDIPLDASIDDGHLQIRGGPSSAPAATLSTTPEALVELARGVRALEEVEQADDLRFDGPADAIQRLRAVFGFERISGSGQHAAPGRRKPA
jgi:DNA-binding HxlR family transcriptional regulator